jgi:hypothetical protein
VESFELDILGGAIERIFRARRPETDRMPWGTLDVRALSRREVEAARASWTDLALQEYAAAASQSNALRLAIRARAPIDLTAMLTQFPFDEIVHTEICARVAGELGGAANLEYEPEEVFPSPGTEKGSPLVVATKTIAWEFCVGETLSLGMLKSHARTARHPLLKAVWSRLAKDEAAHARFGWLFMEWARPRLSRGERREVAAVARRALHHVGLLDEKVRALPEESFTPFGTFGARGKDAYLALSREVLHTNVVARLDAAMV